jgi:hypothetical protein
MAGLPKEGSQMKKRIDFRLLSILCLVVVVFFALSTFAMAAKKEMVKEWISAKDGGSITLEDLTITFDPGVLKKDTKIHIIYFGDGEYQIGPEIKVNGTFTLYFANLPTVVVTFKQGEWIELTCIDGYVETNHFSRYRGC